MQHAPENSDDTYHGHPQPYVAHGVPYVTPHLIMCEESVYRPARHEKAHHRQREDHHSVRSPVADVGAHNSGELHILTPAHIHTPPHLAETRENEIQRIGTEDRHTLPHQRHPWNAGPAELDAPPYAAYHVRKRGYGHHHHRPPEVAAIAHHAHHLPEIDLMEEPHHQYHRNGQRDAIVNHHRDHVPDLAGTQPAQTGRRLTGFICGNGCTHV